MFEKPQANEIVIQIVEQCKNNIIDLEKFYNELINNNITMFDLIQTIKQTNNLQNIKLTPEQFVHIGTIETLFHLCEVEAITPQCAFYEMQLNEIPLEVIKFYSCNIFMLLD